MTDERIPDSAKEVYIFQDNDLPHFNLLSVAKLTTEGQQMVFTKNLATLLTKEGKVILTAQRNGDGLYILQNHRTSNYAAVLFPKRATSSEKVKLYVAAMGSPTTSSMIEAVSNQWLVLPGLAVKELRNHPHSEATSKGHLDRTRSGLDSTKQRTTASKVTHKSSKKCFPRESQQSLYIDLTGRFPHASSRKHEYIMVARCSDTNYIHVVPMRSRSAKDYTNSFLQCINFFKTRGIHHTKVKVDNETSNLFRQVAGDNNIQIEYVPPENHRQNPAERDIRTFKNHLVAALCTTHVDFPISEWDLLLPQIELTLNLLRGSHTQPKISAYEHVIGKYNYSRNPIAPVGTKVIVLNDPNSRPTWAPHGNRGYYLGPAMNHYRSYRILMEDTGRVRVSDSVSWHPGCRDLTDFSVLSFGSEEDESTTDSLHGVNEPSEELIDISPTDIATVGDQIPAVLQSLMIQIQYRMMHRRLSARSQTPLCLKIHPH